MHLLLGRDVRKDRRSLYKTAAFAPVLKALFQVSVDTANELEQHQPRDTTALLKNNTSSLISTCLECGCEFPG